MKNLKFLDFCYDLIYCWEIVLGYHSALEDLDRLELALKKKFRRAN